MARCIPPVHSPLSLRAVGAGAVRWLTGGTTTTIVELLRAHFPSRDLLVTDSGTSALTLALRDLARAQPNQPVALPAYCCYDVATAADGAGVPIVLYDVDPQTLGPDFASLRRALAAGASGVVIAHLYGVPVDVTGVLTQAQEFGATVIDDAAQGAGATFQGRPLGAFGALGIVSFGRGKGVTGSGGGALLGNDERGARIIAALRKEGTLLTGPRGASVLAAAAAQWLLGRPALYGIPSALPFLRLGETIYRRPTEPAGLSAMSAGILQATWPLTSGEAETRRRTAARLLATLTGARSAWSVRVPNAGVAGYLRLPLILPATARAHVARARRLGVAPGYPKALIDLDGFGTRTRTRRESYAGARLLAERLCTLPTHGLLTEPDLHRLEAWLDSTPQ